jgi:hypothetical protein
MRKGTLIGALMGFLAGLVIQVSGSVLTGMATRTLSPESMHFLAVSIVITLFIAALFGVIGAFLGALLEEVLERR